MISTTAEETINPQRNLPIGIIASLIICTAIYIAVALVLTSAGVGNVVHDRAVHSASKRHRRSTLDRVCHVLCDSAHPDAAADPDAMALDIPHLAVTVAGASAVIGPLVIPGRTSCLRCRDLHLADAEHAEDLAVGADEEEVTLAAADLEDAVLDLVGAFGGVLRGLPAREGLAVEQLDRFTGERGVRAQEERGRGQQRGTEGDRKSVV